VVAVRVIVEVVDGKAVIIKRAVAVAVSVELVEGVAVRVLVIVLVVEGVAVIVLVEESEAGTTVGLTDAASLPTVKSTPQT
jgi:hypothetical protein